MRNYNLCRYFFSRNNLLKRNSSVSFNTLSDYAVYCRSRRRSNRRQFKNKTSSPLTILSIHKNHVIFVYFFGKKLLKKLIECGIMFSCWLWKIFLEVFMKHIRTINKANLKETAKKGGCGKCQASCQSACKTSCTVANQKCER